MGKSFAGNMAAAFKDNPAEAYISAATTPKEKGTHLTRARGQTRATGASGDKSTPIGWEVRRESKTRRIQLLARPSVIDEAKRVAGGAGLSLNEWINQLIENAITEEFVKE